MIRTNIKKIALRKISRATAEDKIEIGGEKLRSATRSQLQNALLAVTSCLVEGSVACDDLPTKASIVMRLITVLLDESQDDKKADSIVH